jgi:RNA polymerase sigma-70 factor (ECF subfamily)
MESLNKRIAKGETEAFVELYDLLGDRLLRYLVSRLNSNDAHDVLQEVFVRLVRYHRRLAKSKNLTAYIFLTARNEANRWAGKTRVGMTEQPANAIREVVGNDLPVGSRLENQEVASCLLQQLPDEVQEIIRLKIYSGLTFAEVAKIIRLPESTVATKYRRGIQKMQTMAMESTGSGGKDADYPRDRVTYQGD